MRFFHQLILQSDYVINTEKDIHDDKCYTSGCCTDQSTTSVATVCHSPSSVQLNSGDICSIFALAGEIDSRRVRCSAALLFWSTGRQRLLEVLSNVSSDCGANCVATTSSSSSRPFFFFSFVAVVTVSSFCLISVELRVTENIEMIEHRLRFCWLFFFASYIHPLVWVLPAPQKKKKKKRLRQGQPGTQRLYFFSW